MQLVTIAILSIALLSLGTPTRCLIGYDCRGEGLNITSLSLTEMAECQMENLEPTSEQINLQLLQLNEFDHTSVIQCRIEIDRTIYHCGMHSHISAVHNGRREYIRETSAETCKKLHETGTVFLGNNALLTDLKINATAYHAITFAGTLGVDGTCTGTQFSDPYGTWDNVVVQASIKITLREFQGTIARKSNDIILPSGTRCKASRGNCLDSDGSETYWLLLPVDHCHFGHYDLLYDGIAYKLTTKTGQDAPVIYTVTTKETTFALTKASDTNLCGYNIINTEHPKLFLLEVNKGQSFKTRSQISVNNLDIFTYVNSKFVYVEKHMKTQLTQLYRDIMQQKCALEKQVLENALSLSSIAPDEMAFRLMRSPGYTAITAGEVIYIAKCIPVQCRVRQTKNCYNELPVSHGNNSYYLSPRSRILLKSGTARDCSDVLPPMYQIHGTWFRMMPRPTEAVPPPVIQPLTKPEWKYVSPANLATSGIYSAEDLERLQNHLMFPVERPSMLNTLAQGAMGQQVPKGSISLYNMLDEDSLEKIAKTTSIRLWNDFITFGSASAGILTIFLIIRLIRLIIDSIIRGYALHSIYGWSLHLLGAIWSSVTHLFLQLGSRKRERKTDPEEATSQVQLLQNNDKCSDVGNMSEENKSKTSANTPKTREYGDLRKYLESEH